MYVVALLKIDSPINNFKYFSEVFRISFPWNDNKKLDIVTATGLEPTTT